MKPKITRGLGALTPATWAEIYATVAGAGADGGGGTITRPPKTAGGDRERFLATIGAATQIAGKAIWNYAWTQVRAQTTSTSVTTANVTNGLSSTTQGVAWNILEWANTATIAYGYSVADGTDLTDYEGFKIDKVPAGTVVQMWLTRATDGTLRAEFMAPNPITGECPAAPLPVLGTSDYGTFISPADDAEEYDGETFAAPNTTVYDFTTF